MKCLVYYRMSSDAQTDSIERQKNEVEPVIKREGDEVIGVYIDRGKSGSKHREKRLDFLRMINDIKNGTEARKLYLWDLARFTREHPFEAAEFYKLLMKSEILIHDVKLNEIDLTTTTGRMIVNMIQEQSHSYSTTISDNSTSGRRRLLEEGWWVAGAIPYGYQRLYIGPNGDKVSRPRNDSGYTKPRGYHLALSIIEEEAAFVRAMYDMYLNQDTSLRAIARWLNERGVLAPSGDATKAWKAGTVANILDNKAYCGYSHIGGGNRRLRDDEAFGHIGDNEVESDKVPAIVTKECWNRTKSERDKSKNDHRNPKPDQHGHLSGVLYCGHCGKALDKAKRSNRKRHPYTYYSCQSGARYPGGCQCRQWRVLEKDMLPFVLDKLFDGIDASIQEIESVEVPSSDEEDRSERLAEQLEQIEESISRANRRFMKAASLSPQMESDHSKLVEEYESQKNRIGNQIRRLEISGPSKKQIEDGLKSLRSMLCVAFTQDDEIILSGPNASGKRSLRVRLKNGSPDRKALFHIPVVAKDEIRAFLKRLGVKVYIFWQPRAKKDKRGGILRDKSGEIVRSQRNFEVEKIRLNAEFRPEQLFDIGSNNYTRECSLDKGSGCR